MDARAAFVRDMALQELQKRHFPEYFKDKEFTTDWTTPHLANWNSLLSPIRETVRCVLEIGSYEGRSSVFWLNYLDQCTLICADRFTDPDVEARFDRNLAPFGARVRKMK